MWCATLLLFIVEKAHLPHKDVSVHEMYGVNSCRIFLGCSEMGCRVGVIELHLVSALFLKVYLLIILSQEYGG